MKLKWLFDFFFDVKSTRGVQIMMVNGGLPGEFDDDV